MKYHFQFDPGLCVHCHACAAACTLENGKEQSVPWRSVITSNLSGHPRLQTLNVSMACNHCEDAACLKYCPAKAYSYDPTGAVLIDNDKCLGCSYCTWVCPYQAPRLNNRGVIEKCTFCIQRLQEDREPACTVACPTGALGFGREEEYPGTLPAYLPDTGIQPRIVAAEQKTSRQKVFTNNPPPQRHEADTSGAVHISPAGEWSLWIFTAVSSLLFGLVTASFGKPPLLPWWLFALLAGMIAAMSLIHLKNPSNIHRVFLNIKQSPLSREILFFGFFSLLALFSLAFSMPLWFRFLVFAAGLLMLLSIDQVYIAADKSLQVITHSAGALLTGLAWLFFFRTDGYLFLFFVCLKTALFTWRVFSRKDSFRWQVPLWVLRTGLLVLGLLFFLREGLVWYSVLPVVFSEFTDRLYFYRDLKPAAVAHTLNSCRAGSHAAAI